MSIKNGPTLAPLQGGGTKLRYILLNIGQFSPIIILVCHINLYYAIKFDTTSTFLFQNFYSYSTYILLYQILPTILPTLLCPNDILFSEARYINFLLEENILYKQAICPHYHIPMIRLDKRWRYPKKSSIVSLNLQRHPLFSNCHIPCNKVLLVSHLWLTQDHLSCYPKLTGHSTATIA